MNNISCRYCDKEILKIWRNNKPAFLEKDGSAVHHCEQFMQYLQSKQIQSNVNPAWPIEVHLHRNTKGKFRYSVIALGKNTDDAITKISQTVQQLEVYYNKERKI